MLDCVSGLLEDVLHVAFCSTSNPDCGIVSVETMIYDRTELSCGGNFILPIISNVEEKTASCRVPLLGIF